MKPERRKFLATAAATAVTAETALAQDPKADPLAQQVDACLAIARLRFRAPRGEAEDRTLRTQIMRRVVLGELLGRTRVTNGEEPAAIFIAE